ncbi:MAG TPA: DNA polymerase III subunit gamma/tau, partial [Planctomycetota bacterium]|nr:DNA polymerase III subunit gamma/tau [Planctomycetota bacterium]
SYLVLARKYRPRTFAEVAGQELITSTLQGAIREGRVGHAYLFTGPRGTGKTTIARIFAKALNCEKGPAPDPCGVCERCLAVDSGSDVDVVEIDAASNTGVENIRDLREHAAYTPMRARFKVFIIDEVHMLSRGAFNALLKTLEEPPPHVKFLFATTEINKVPDTILSRCQVLRLSLFNESEIAERLTHIFGLESVKAAPGVGAGLARLAHGSMRDALSVTDQLLALVGNEPTLEDVARLAGASSGAKVAELLDALLAHDEARSLELLGPAEGGEGEWVDGLLRELRGALLIAICKDDSALTSDFSGDRERLTRIGKALGSQRLQLWMEDLLAARERMEDAPSLARTVLELALLELCRDEKSLPLSVLVARLAALEQKLGAPPARAPAREPAKPEAAPAPARAASEAPSSPALRPQVLRPTPPPAPYTTGSSAARGAIGHKPTWDAFVARIAAADAALGALLARRGMLVDIDAERVHVQLKELRPDERASLAAAGVNQRCAQAFQAVLGRPVAVVFEDVAQRQSGEKDAFTRSVAQMFDGKIEDKT